MRKKKCYPPSNDLRINAVPGEIVKVLKEIATNKGITQSALVKNITKAVVESYPLNVREGRRRCGPCKEVRVTNISPKTKMELENIANYYGTDISNLMRPFLEKFIEELPVPV